MSVGTEKTKDVADDRVQISKKSISYFIDESVCVPDIYPSDLSQTFILMIYVKQFQI